MTPGSDEQLRKELAALGARDVEIAALTSDPDRGLAALNYAQTKGATSPISYAKKLYDNADWYPVGVRRVATNVHVDRACDKCGGDRFVPVTDDWSALYGENWAPCSGCNADVNAGFWRVDGTRVKVVAR